MESRLVMTVVALLAILCYADTHGTIFGKVMNENGQPLMGVQLWLEKENSGDVSDADGGYSVNVTFCGEHILIAQFVGYKSETLRVECGEGKKVRQDITLLELPITGEPVEVTGKREAIHKADETLPTIVIPQEMAKRTGAQTLGSALELDSGVRLQSRCSMCAASEISIQGLPGRYSLILFDGMPILSGLASKYILDMFPTDFMDRVEVLKGASGGVLGSGAIAGAVNIVPLQPVGSSEIKTAFIIRNFGSDVTGVFGSGSSDINFNAMVARNERRAIDLNEDNISENVAFSRNIYMSSLKLTPSHRWTLNFGGTIAGETRKAGPMVDDAQIAETPGAEKVITQRWDLWHRTAIDLKLVEPDVKIAVSSHNEEGILDGRAYSAEQRNLYSEISFKIRKPALFVAGISFNRLSISDERIFEDYRENNIGVWVSMSGNIDGIKLFGAARSDFNSIYSTILSPYLGMQFSLAEINFDIVGGTGFRTPSILFETIQNLGSGFLYAIRRAPDISEEKSYSVQAGVNRMFVGKDFAVDIRLNFFSHHVKDFISACLDGIDSTTGKAIFYYYNVSDKVASTGVELSSAFTLPLGIDINTGVYLLSPKVIGRDFLPFINRWGGNFTATHRNDNHDYEVTISGAINGPMRVETIYSDGKIVKGDSPTYFVSNVKATKRFNHIEILAGVNNIGDIYQKPVSHSDGTTEYYWGPQIGRELYCGIGVEF